MNTPTARPEPLIPPDVMADLEEAARYAASGVWDVEVMRQACERMDRTREAIRGQAGPAAER
jgi:hypothetical protein